MYVFITILILLVCVLLVLIVLVQNPKGGGLSATFGGGGNQLMGARRTTDFLEKGTWTLAVALLIFSLVSSAFVPGGQPETTKTELEQKASETTAPLPELPNNLTPIEDLEN